MTECVLLRLSWPRKPLWQNRPCHWSKKGPAVKAYRHEAWGEALNRGVRNLSAGRPVLMFSYAPPDKRKRDIPNVNAAMKAAVDGIADALGMDDSTFRYVWPDDFEEPAKGGAVLVEITTEAV